MITLAHMLTLSAVLFALSVAGIFLNRKNVLLLLMCIELLLLAANFNFVAFSRYLGQLDGQIFVFFVLTVAAAESAIGLAILVVLFRERRSINVEDLNTAAGLKAAMNPTLLARDSAAAAGSRRCSPGWPARLIGRARRRGGYHRRRGGRRACCPAWCSSSCWSSTRRTSTARSTPGW